MQLSVCLHCFYLADYIQRIAECGHSCCVHSEQPCAKQKTQPKDIQQSNMLRSISFTTETIAI